MKRHGSFKKIKIPDFIRSFKEMLVQKAAGLSVIIIFLIVLFVLGKAFLYRSDYFFVRTVEVRSAFLDKQSVSALANQLLASYRGRNIFKISLPYIGESLRRIYPDAREVTVNAMLPDKIFVSMKFRKPVAYIKANRIYTIDEEAFVLPAAANAQLTNLPMVEGVDVGYSQASGKRSISSKNMKVAMELLKELRELGIMARYGVSRINVRNVENIEFYLRSGVEIRISADGMRDRLELLGKTLRDSRLLLDRIKYIDVRFKDVTIGPK